MIEISNQSCYEHIKTIKDSSINLIITDPPYIMPQMKGGKNSLDKSIYKNWNKIDKNPLGLRNGFDLNLLNEFERIQPFMNAYIFCNAKLMQEIMAFYYNKGFTKIEILVMNKINPIPAYRGHYLPDMEYILYICDNKSSLRFSNIKDARKLFNIAIGGGEI